jgi:Ni/Fe-hydrogenase subunit HybB-like protein
LVLFGLVLNRFNTGLIFFDGTPYLPAWQEIAVSAGFIAAGIAAFDFVAQVFPLFDHETA